LQPFLTLQRNLEVPGMFARTKRTLRQAQSAKLADNVSLNDRLKHLPNELSGGQMQRAAIARALLNNPKIILADEPTGNLDRENAFAIMDLFDKIREQFGTTVIVVTHDSELASRADREIRLRDGQIIS
jgi:putative ABC transport system ATP-binding protein